MNVDALKAATDFQKEMLKQVQDQLKALDDRGRNFITLGSGALAAIALVSRPVDVFANPALEPGVKWISLLCIGAAVALLIFALQGYLAISQPTLPFFPDPSDVGELASTEDAPTVQQSLLDTYADLTTRALELLVQRTRATRRLQTTLLAVSVLLLLYLIVPALNYVSSTPAPPPAPTSPSTPITPPKRP
ncbi:MAG: hypothetical protein HC933_00860 [Pleurocapsa sp. SU_196_0]|nr:hypothetical protein [Pleurocapsa sp. SU_196_0]